MGLINVFIEHYNVKTLFICNERKLENIIPKYKEIKEKYIRFTYEFNPELKEILNSIIQGGKYKNISDFIDKDVVVDVFKRGKSKNIRTLFFVLDVFAKIKYLLDDYKESDSYNDLKTLVLHYICFYSIERKQRGIDALILSKISISFFNPHISLADIFDGDEDDNNLFSQESQATTQIASTEDKIIQKIQTKYFSKGHIPFEQFLSIAEYINSGFFNEEKLKKEIETINREFQHKKIKNSQTKFIEGLSDFSLTDEDFLPFIDELYKEVDKGNFDLLTYLKLYSQLVWLESFEIKGLHITDEVTDRFKNAVKKSVENGYAKFIQNLNYQIPQWEGESKFNAFLRFVESVNNSLEVKQKVNNTQRLIKAVQDKEEEILSELLSKDSDLVLEENDAQKIFEVLIKSEASMNNLFDEAIVNRYANEGSISQLPKNEKKFITKLNELIEAENQKHDEIPYSYLPVILLGQYLTKLTKD